MTMNRIAPQQTVHPTGEKAKLRFDAHHCEFPFDFYLVADFECFLEPQQSVVSTHVPTGFCVYRVSAHEKFRSTAFTYDGDFLLQFFRKKYTVYTTKSGKTAYADVGVIPLNGERNLLLSIGNVVFVDSCQFLVESLDNFVKAKRNSGLDDFVHATRHFGRNDLFFKKGRSVRVHDGCQ